MTDDHVGERWRKALKALDFRGVRVKLNRNVTNGQPVRVERVASLG
jgi:hypothetical protein